MNITDATRIYAAALTATGYADAIPEFLTFARKNMTPEEFTEIMKRTFVVADSYLLSFPRQDYSEKIRAIKAMRALSSELADENYPVFGVHEPMGLKDAKDFVESLNTREYNCNTSVPGHILASAIRNSDIELYLKINTVKVS